jgi:2-polyprenyl-3-methyl-5-hydroxy-6-metoxy-1,4-benzoquinol methylase
MATQSLPLHGSRQAVKEGLVDVSCPLCASDKFSVYVWAPSHYGPEKYKVTQCTQCSMILTNPQPTTYDMEVEERGVLGRHFNPKTLEKRRRIASLVLSVIAPMVPGRRVLDFGCGEGSFVAQADAEGWDAAGIDLNRGLVVEANRHWGFNRLWAGSLDEYLASSPKAFDAIVATQVFEHIQRPVEMGRTLARLLNPNGIMYIDVPNANQLAEWKSRGITLDPTAHWNHFTVKTLSALMQKMGLEVVDATGAPSLINLYSRLGLGQGALPLARLSRKVLPGIGTGVCVIGRRSGPSA